MEIKPNEKIRVRLESFNHELLNTSCQKIMEITQGNNIDNVGVVSLPTDKRIYCVLRSPHVNKDSREHFEIRIHKRILEIYYDSSVNKTVNEINFFSDIEDYVVEDISSQKVFFHNNNAYLINESLIDNLNKAFTAQNWPLF